MLKITNTMTGNKELFTPRNEGVVNMYICGVTPYAPSHIGHGRCYVAFDLFYRVLQLAGYSVVYCRNFTDIDDKLLNRAEQEFGDKHRYTEIADACIRQFHDDMTALNCISPDFEPRVTHHIPDIIEFIQGLIEEGKAYAVGGDVYFHIASFPQYGKLSKHNIKDLRAGSRIDVEHNKKDPLDFALWKSEAEGTFWESPWGYGRPGWHIECSALASYYLGERIDVHGGGLDLVFPHHENEIAQSEGLYGGTFARYWMHNGFVLVDKEKMSKSLGNFLTLDEIFKQFDPMVIRFYYLSHRYRAPMDFSFDDIKSVQKSYQRLCKFFESCKESTVQSIAQSMRKDAEKIKGFPIVQKMWQALLDDLNTPAMFGTLFESLDILADPANKQEMCAVKAFLLSILGLTLEPLPEKAVELTPEITQLLAEREKARAEKNWARADEIRDQLTNLGVDIHDKKL
jgi:cysteinyl-tRNA synthetase